MNGDKSVSIKTKSLREKAGDAHQQYGALTRSVSKNQKITIGGESIQTTKDVVKISSTDERIELYGKKELKLQDEKGGMLIIDEDLECASKMISLRSPKVISTQIWISG
jgi:hypothetical protein